MSNFRNLSNNKSIRQPTVLATIKSNNQTTGRPIRQCNVQPTVKSDNKITGRPIRQCTVQPTVKSNNKATVKSNNKATDKPIREPTVRATVKSNKKATHQTMDQPTVLATVNACNEANNTIIDQSLVADQAEVKVLKDTVDANHNADLLVEISLDSAVELSLLTDKEEDELHTTKEVPLTRPDGPIPSILVTGPTNPCLTSAAYYANMPKTISPGFLQVPGARPSFFNTPSLPNRIRPRKAQPTQLDGPIPSILVTGPTNPCLTSAAYYANMPKTISPGFLQVPGARPSFFNTPSLPNRIRPRKAQPTQLDGPIPSILVTGPTNPCLTSAAYYANMPKTISPGFLQVPGARPSFFSTPSLPSRLRPRKAQPFRADLGDAELADAFLVVEEPEQDTVDASHNADQLVEISLDSAVELSLLTDKEEDELHTTKEVPLTRPDGPIPSILVTGPTNPCLTSAAYYANMPKTISPGFLQVPGARPSFFSTPSLPSRLRPRKAQPFRSDLGDAELADAFLVAEEPELLFIASLDQLRNFNVLPGWEKGEVSKTAASVEEDIESTNSLAPTATMTGHFSSGPFFWGSAPYSSTRTAKATLINSSSIASKKSSTGSSKAKIGCKSSSSSPFQIKSIGSSKTTTMERVSRVSTARASPQPVTERVTRSSTRRAAPRT
ncbi:hypothetical protein A4X03_0g522 [Tilletia caries]|uniref:Uncharacterized protein n=1 Tax=Tilletia caries TaxID=13290 RepID=A0A8T8TRV3_9BASI|nr:hypothetical protein A4X03_0g522 [Tilletia caries]